MYLTCSSVCLFQILRVLGESAIAVRTKAMKCLSEVVAVDPSILARVKLSSSLTPNVHSAAGDLCVCVLCSLICSEVFTGV